MLKIRLRRVGAKNRPSYRIVIADARAARDGSFVEQIGHYDPKTDPPTIVLDRERADEWIGKGAQPTDSVVRLFKTHENQQSSVEQAPEPEPEKATAKKATKKSAKATAKGEEPTEEPVAKGTAEATAEAEEAAAAGAEQATDEPVTENTAKATAEADEADESAGEQKAAE